MNLNTEAHKLHSKMKARGGRSSWSFKFLAKRQSRSVSTSTFYCYDLYEAPAGSPITMGTNSDSPNDSPSKEKVKPSDVVDLSLLMSNKHDPDDADDLVSFCCGLRKIPSKSTSFNWTPSSTVCLPEVARKRNDRNDVDLAHAAVKNQCEPSYQNCDFVPSKDECDLVKEMTLVPCKRDTLYPQTPTEDDGSQIIGLTQEWETEFPVNLPEGHDMSTVLERRKLFEVADGRPRSSKPASVLRPLRHLNSQKFRNSFTTEDADLFMKKSNLDKQKLSHNPSVPPKPNFARDQSPKLLKVAPVRHSNSHSMRDLSNARFSGEEGTAEASTASKTRSPPMNTPNGPQKPRVPPKSTKLISYASQVIRQKELEMSGDCTQQTNKDFLSDSLSSDSDSLEDSDVDDSTCLSGIGQGDHPHLDFGSKAQKVANELLETEKVYVKKLFLIDQIFHMEVIRRNRLERFIPDEVIPQIFSNIKCIYQFHNDYLLPELSTSMERWEQEPRVGPVMKKAAPFFKLYTDFVTNFSNASRLISSWISKSEKFAQILEELQKHPECGNLTLQHHLLEPIQRVPRYQLLLTEYLKRLPDDSPDREPVEAALKLVSEAAQHTNDEMKKMEKFKKLLDTCATLVHSKNENLVSINRELVKEGKMTKVSARDGSLLERYLFLFNDVLLVCMCLPLKIGFGQQYLVKSKLDICGMKVYEGDNEDHPNSFVIMSKQKSIEFTASSADEKTEWVTEIWSVIKQFVDKERTKDKEFLKKMYVREEELGKRAPTWVKDQDTSMCMLCSVTFKTFKRRHHCRACGKVVCNECSTHKLRMDFDMDKLNRVCDVCYGILEFSSPSTTKIAQRHKGPKVLGVKAASDQNVLCGNLNLSLDNKTWAKRWLVLRSNCALYIFKAKRDNAATDSLPLPGYSVEECKSDENSKANVFKIFHEKLPKVYFFSIEDKSLCNKWLESLRLAIRAELPSTPQVSSASSCPVTTPALLPANELSLIDEINKEMESSAVTLSMDNDR